VCTLGSVNGKYLFKNRDLSLQNCWSEEIIYSRRRYSYVGVAGRAAVQERGLNSGINEKGIAAAITYVGGGYLEDDLGRKIPRGVIIEEIVGNAATLMEALEIAQWHLNRDIHVGGNIVIAGDIGIISIEEIDRRIAVEFIDRAFFFRSNHFLNLSGPVDGSDTQERLVAISRIFEGKKPDEVSLRHIQEALAHRGEDALICKRKEDHINGEASITVSTVIYDIGARTVHYKYTCDPASVFQTFQPMQPTS